MWTVEPGRAILFNGTLMFSVVRSTYCKPVEADRATHVIADLFNKNGITPDTLYRDAMGYEPPISRRNET